MWESVLAFLGNPTVQNIGANILGNVAAASIANKGADAAADATREASAQSVALNRDIFNTNLALSKPFYQGSGNAFNLLSNIYGLPAQNFNFPTSGMSSSGVDSQGNPLLANWGAGQPVAGHTGGGGNYGMEGGIAAGMMSGNPLAGLVGGALGGLVRKGGDNWTTLGTQAPAGYDYEAYMKSPGLMEEWAKPDVQALFNGNRDAYAYWHANGGMLNGKQSWAPNMEYLTEVTSKNPKYAGDKSTMPVGGAQQESVGGATSTASGGMGDPLQLFWNSPDGKLATNQFLTIDTPKIQGAFATAGKALSGAQQKALSDRGAAMAGNAFNNYRGGLERMAGFGTSASSQAQSAGNTFANSATNAIQNNGLANANASLARNNNWANAFGNAASYGYDQAKQAGWIT